MRVDTWVLKDERNIDRKCREGIFQVESTVGWKPIGKMHGSYGEQSRMG